MTKQRTLVSFFGIDGSGKTTQCKILCGELTRKGWRVGYVWSRRDPFILKPLVRLVKRSLLGENHATEGDRYTDIIQRRHKIFTHFFVRQVWFCLSLLEYRFLLSTKVFKPNKNVDVLICDRYLPDAIVDLATNFNYNTTLIHALFQHPVVRAFPRPAMSFFLDVPPEVGATRKSDGTGESYLSDRVSLYQAAAREIGAIRIDGTIPVNDIAAQIMGNVLQQMSKINRNSF